ncbi:unnamed protein product [Durusdinium trenchii]|uniref:Uncharacterized protein n=2 Tax=Durusdinium trenchii TaxID=1381693 RepID=A0ABP0JV38_9DINO
MAPLSIMQPLDFASKRVALQRLTEPVRRSPRRLASNSSSEPPLSAEVVFCLLAVGSSSCHAWPKTRKSAASLFGNRRDSLARSLLAALQTTAFTHAPRTAAAILFEAGKRFKDLSWWVVGPEFLQQPFELTEFGILRRLRRVADQEEVPGVVFHQQDPGPRGLREAILSFLNKLGDAQDSAVVLLDESYPAVPVAGSFRSTLVPDASVCPARRVVFFLGCPRAVDEDQEAAISWAAEKANWQLLRFSLGWVSEFTSKIVSRIKLWHASGGLLPVVGGLLCIERGTVHWQPPADADGFLQESYGDYGWPSPKKVDSFEPGLGPRIHFVVHVQLQLKEMKIGDWSPAHSLVARCCLAALWRAHGAYYRCLVAFVFLPDGQGATPVVTVSRKFAGRFMGKAATEHEVLVALCAAIDDAKQRPCTKQKPVKWAVCVRWPETQAAWKTVVAYPKDSVVELVIRGSSCSEKSSGNVLYLASADSGIDVLVVHVLKRHTHLSDALHAVLQPAVVATNSAEVICILQSALLDTGPAGRALLAMLLEKKGVTTRPQEPLKPKQLNYYELARQFDFQAQAKALAAAQAPGVGLGAPAYPPVPSPTLAPPDVVKEQIDLLKRMLQVKGYTLSSGLVLFDQTGGGTLDRPGFMRFLDWAQASIPVVDQDAIFQRFYAGPGLLNYRELISLHEPAPVPTGAPIPPSMPFAGAPPMLPAAPAVPLLLPPAPSISTTPAIPAAPAPLPLPQAPATTPSLPAAPLPPAAPVHSTPLPAPPIRNAPGPPAPSPTVGLTPAPPAPTGPTVLGRPGLPAAPMPPAPGPPRPMPPAAPGNLPAPPGPGLSTLGRPSLPPAPAAPLAPAAPRAPGLPGASPPVPPSAPFGPPPGPPQPLAPSAPGPYTSLSTHSSPPPPAPSRPGAPGPPGPPISSRPSTSISTARPGTSFSSSCAPSNPLPPTAPPGPSRPGSLLSPSPPRPGTSMTSFSSTSAPGPPPASPAGWSRPGTAPPPPGTGALSRPGPSAPPPSPGALGRPALLGSSLSRGCHSSISAAPAPPRPLAASVRFG